MAYTAEDLPHGTVMLTGANSGLGAAFAAAMLDLQVIPKPFYLFPVRNPGDKSCRQLTQSMGDLDNNGAVVQLDLSSLESIRAFSSDVNVRVAAGSMPRIRTMFLNAGVLPVDNIQTGKEGYELAFTVNYLANFLLVLLLLESMDKTDGRIVIVSSSSANPKPFLRKAYETKHLSFVPPKEAAKPPQGESALGYGPALRRYGATKLMGLMFVHQLQRRLDADPTLQRVSVLSMNPGSSPDTNIVRTKSLAFRIARGVFSPALNCYARLNPTGHLRTIPRIAQDMIFVAFNKSVLGENPKRLYLHGRQILPSNLESQDKAKQTLLWEGSLELVDMQKGETTLVNWR